MPAWASGLGLWPRLADGTVARMGRKTMPLIMASKARPDLRPGIWPDILADL
jgi:hypothetical protein